VDLLAYLLALFAQPAAAQPATDSTVVAQPYGGGIPITPGPHQN
jgi:hypothetical protein